ncbi:MAG: hypothetical protein ACYS0H_08900 [Planctomycetota bacterium]
MDFAAFFQTLIQALAVSATPIALALAWFTYVLQQRSSLRAKRQRKVSLIGAATTELKNIEHWIGDYPVDHEYENDPKFDSWKDPERLVYPFTHSAIGVAAKEGVERGLSLELVTQLVEFEQAILVFEQALDLVSKFARDHPLQTAEISRKLAYNRGKEPTAILSFSQKERDVISATFTRNRYLHVHCIGEEIKGRNLNSTYRRSARLLEQELRLIDSAREWSPPRWYWLLHIVAVLFLFSGVGHVVWSLAAFESTPPPISPPAKRFPII